MGKGRGKRCFYKRKGREILFSLSFFLAGIIFVCWQEGKNEKKEVTYGEIMEYMQEHGGNMPEDCFEEEQEKENNGEEVEPEERKEEARYITGDVFSESEQKENISVPCMGKRENVYASLYGGRENSMKIKTLCKTRSLEYLLENFYIINPTTTIDKKVFQVDQMLEKDCRIKKKKEPQILIFHTHGASEYFSDSERKKEDSVIGVGARLKEILEKQYGYSVMHDETAYDLIDGEIDRNQAYTVAENALAEILEKHPSIEVMIDLHRDASSDGKTKRVTTIQGKKVAQVMFFNGLSRNLSGDIKYLHNPNLEGNLAFSLQMKMKAMEKFPDFTLPIFLKGYRYSLHLREKSLLIELGNEVNTVEEAKNAMEPLAYVLDAVLSGK